MTVPALHYWWNRYVGIPYTRDGESPAGCDCWGLVRLVYREVLKIDLPRPEGIVSTDPKQVAGVMLTTRDAMWEQVTDEPQSGDVLHFRIGGQPMHVGIVTRAPWMLHVREGADAAVESYDALRWKSRLEGVYRYAGTRVTDLLAPTGDSVRILGCPNPFSTQRVDAVVLAGATLAEIIDEQCDRLGVPPEVRTRGHAYVGATYVPHESWGTYRPLPGSVITFRITPRGGKNFLLVALSLAVMVAALAVGGWVAGAEIFANGGTLLGLGGSFWGGLASAAVGLVGMIAVKALAPAASQKHISTDATKIYSVQSINNQKRGYEPLPVIFGFHRFSPDYVTDPYTELQNGGQEQYLRVAFTAGYGPLAISDVRIGDTLLSSYSEVTYEQRLGYDSDPALTLMSRDANEESVSITLEKKDGYHVKTTEDDVDTIEIEFVMPYGLYGLSSSTGKILKRRALASIQYRAIGGSYADINVKINAKEFTLDPCFEMVSSNMLYDENGVFNGDEWWIETYGVPKTRQASEIRIPLYQWHVFSLDVYNNIIHRFGCETDNKDSEPSKQLLSVIGASRYNWSDGYSAVRIPSSGANEELLAYVCCDSTGIIEVIDKRDSVSVTGCVATATDSATISFSSGEIDRSGAKVFDITASQQSPIRRVISWDVPRGKYDIRVARINDNSGYANPTYDTLQWSVIRTFSSKTSFTPPVPICLQAIKIKATNQLNGVVDEFNALYKRICLDYVYTSGTWVARPTNNCASMFRWALQGPASPRPLENSEIDLTQLAHWHNFCRLQGFTYNEVRTSRSGVWDTLQDICAAGRAWPTVIDGKWSVIIDEPRTTVVQHFTPHNSWGFEGHRNLESMPHALRVQYNNEKRGYIQDELIVYADGYSASNATLFETTKFPGVTNPDQVYAIGRYMLAVGVLRPESYILNTDIEHLVCTRGDLVRVTHDVPMWGISSGRVNSITMSGVYCIGLGIDTPVPMQATDRYTLRIRLGNLKGKTRTLDLTPVSVDGEYPTVSFPPITSDVPAVGDLCLFGLVGSESTECIVSSIVPDQNGNAKITLTDYGKGIFSADEKPIGEYHSNITLPQALQSRIVTTVPIINSVRSDESALIVGSDGTLTSRIAVSCSLPDGADSDITDYQIRYKESADDGDWSILMPSDVSFGTLYASPVIDGLPYDVSVRCITSDGRYGPWAVADTYHVVIGKTSPPPDVKYISVENKHLVWSYADSPLDLEGFMVRCAYGDVSNWSNCSPVRDGFATSCSFDITNYIDDRQRTWMVKALDTGGRLSENPARFVTASLEAQADDPAPRNQIAVYDLAEIGWPGFKTGCTVVGDSPGILAAQESSLFWGTDLSELFWSPPDSSFWGSNYSRMSYEFTWHPDETLVGLDMREEIVTTASIESISYSTGSESLFWADTTPQNFLLFIVAGQSNAVGSAKTSATGEDASTVGMFYNYPKNTWSPIIDPVYPSSDGSAWPAFARKMCALTGKRVLLVNASMGGTRVTTDTYHGYDWTDGSTLRPRMYDMVTQSVAALSAWGITYDLGGILWVQGESDGAAISTGEIVVSEYTDGTVDLFTWLKNTFNTNVYMSKTGYWEGYSDSAFEQIQAAQDAICASNAGVYMAFSDAPTFRDNDLLVDAVHYNQDGCNIMGEAFAEYCSSFVEHNTDDKTAPSFWDSFPDDAPFWGPFTWYPLPNVLQKIQNRFYSFKVSISNSENISEIYLCKLIIDVPDIREELSASISSSGTQLQIKKGYRDIKYVYLTLEDDGGDATTCRCLDKSITGPFVKCYDITGIPCSGTVNAIVIGY